MKVFKLSKERVARVWPNGFLPVEKRVLCDANDLVAYAKCEGTLDVVRGAIAVELFVPVGGRFLYGMLACYAVGASTELVKISTAGLNGPLRGSSFDPFVKGIDEFIENVDEEYHQFILEAAKNSLKQYRKFPSQLVFEGGVQGEISSSGVIFSRLSRLCVELLGVPDADLKEKLELSLNIG